MIWGAILTARVRLRGDLCRLREVFQGKEPFEIIANAYQGPFERDVGVAPQTEAPESHYFFDDTEDRFDRLLA